MALVVGEGQRRSGNGGEIALLACHAQRSRIREDDNRRSVMPGTDRASMKVDIPDFTDL